MEKHAYPGRAATADQHQRYVPFSDRSRTAAHVSDATSWSHDKSACARLGQHRSHAASDGNHAEATIGVSHLASQVVVRVVVPRVLGSVNSCGGEAGVKPTQTPARVDGAVRMPVKLPHDVLVAPFVAPPAGVMNQAKACTPYTSSDRLPTSACVG
jgi:hypothetical protein